MTNNSPPPQTDILPTAKDYDLTNCLECRSVIGNADKRCPHCHGHLHKRKENSNYKTWMYLITSIILYFPANLLPITNTSVLNQMPQGDTIISGVVLLWGLGSYVVAAIIFLASILTPTFKIVVLLYLLLNQEPKKPPYLQTKLYRFIHFVGRWSMIDVFVVALLGALIHGKLAAITPGLGIFAFAGVVVFTMLATETFDIRNLWDNYRKTHHPLRK